MSFEGHRVEFASEIDLHERFLLPHPCGTQLGLKNREAVSQREAGVSLFSHTHTLSFSPSLSLFLPHSFSVTCAVCLQFQSAAAVRHKEEQPPLPLPQASPLFTRRRPKQVVHSYEQSRPNCADTAASAAGAADSADGADCPGHPHSPRSAILVMRGMLQRLQRVEDEITQVTCHSFAFVCFLSSPVCFSDLSSCLYCLLLPFLSSLLRVRG